MPHRGETEAQAETRRLAFEERRVQRVDGHIWELERDHPEIFRAVEQNIIHVPYYGTKEEQDRFLNSIADTQIGQEMLRLQTKFNKDYRIPLILPKFSNFPNITINEQQWLAMFGLVIDVTAQTIGVTRKPDAFKRIEQVIDIGVITDPSTSSGYRTNTLKYGYEEPETQVVTDYIEPVEITPTSVQKKPESVFQQEPEPEITTADIDPPGVEEPEKLYEVYGQTLPLSESAVDYYESLGVSVTTSQVEPPAEEEPEIITSQVEPPDLIDTIDTIDTIETSQVEPPGQEVTAQISWFGNTWFPWHLELEDRRRR